MIAKSPQFITSLSASSVCEQKMYDAIGGDCELRNQLAKQIAEHILREPSITRVEIRNGDVFTHVRLQIVTDERPFHGNRHAVPVWIEVARS